MDLPDAHPGARRRVETSPGTVGLVVLVAFADGQRAAALSWLAAGRLSLRGIPGLTFCKILGSGAGAGFGVRPGLSHQGLFCAFRDETSADAFLNHSLAMAFYRKRAAQLFCVKLRAVSTRGRWSGVVPLAVTADAQVRPGDRVASLTRASIRPSKALQFWRHAGPSEASLQRAAGCIVAAGLGEVPLLRQATFTIWETAQAMTAFAREGAHGDAIQAVRLGGIFSEELFARFQPYDMRGAWKGRDFG